MTEEEKQAKKKENQNIIARKSRFTGWDITRKKEKVPNYYKKSAKIEIKKFTSNVNSYKFAFT